MMQQPRPGEYGSGRRARAGPCSHSSFTHIAGALALAAALCPLALAEGPSNPEVGYVFPAGGRAGDTVDVRLGIYQWTPDLQYFVHRHGVQLKIDGQPGPLLLQEQPHATGRKAYNPPPLPREVPARFVIPADASPGPIRWQIANANGISRTGIFTVSRNRELVEDEEQALPQPVGELPVMVSGRLRRNEEIDRYVIKRKSPGPVTCELFARRLGSAFHAAIEVHDAGGTRIADAVDTQGLDAACTFFAQAGKGYVVSVHDLDFLGNRAFVYRMALTAGPRVLAAVPRRNGDGKTSIIEFFGFGIATGHDRVEQIKREMAIPGEPRARVLDYCLETPFGLAPSIKIDLTDTSGPVLVDAPGAVTQVFRRPARVHRYQFRAKKGERLWLAAKSQVVAAPIDLSLTVLGPDGKELGRNDDLTGTTDAGFEFVAASDGPHTAVVTDLSEAGVLPHVYRLSINHPQPDFSVEIPQRIELFIGEKGELPVKIQRTGGFEGAVRLTVEGLSESIHFAKDLGELVVPQNATEAKFPLFVERNAPATASVLQLAGNAQIEGHAVTRTATAPLSDNLAPNIPDEVRIPQAVIASLLKPRVRVWPVESDERTVNRGTVHLAEIGIERLEGYDGEVLFQLESRQPNKFRQGVAGPDVVIPPGQARVFYPCFVSHELETSDAYRVSVSALARVRDPRGVEHWLVSNMQPTVSVALTIEGGLLKLMAEPRSLRVQSGSTVTVPVRVFRSPRLAKPVTVRAVIPQRFANILSSNPVIVPPDRETANVVLRVSNGPLPTGEHELTFMAVATQEAQVPRLAEGLHATPLDSANLDLLARGFLPVTSQAAVALDFAGEQRGEADQRR